ncbi:hypothetical protein [Streptomyces sp. enrichment culture]|uniref:hypothetical protein n=1 Tax=Streptomyces sp. enrichment culture TaxID=1795815 RepID=UPI003F54B386
MIANVVRLDGTWQAQPTDLLRRLSDKARRIEQDLRLITPVTGPPGQQAAARPTTPLRTGVATGPLSRRDTPRRSP